MAPGDGRRRPGGDQVIPRPAAWRPGGPPPWAGAGSVELSAAAVAERLARHRGGGAPMVPAFADARPSAVLVVLVDGADGAEVLLTRRSLHLTSHRGEISFPGGRMDPGETPVEAALREAAEEVGLDPAAVRVRGELDHLSTVVSRSYIVPVVAEVRGKPELRAMTREVDRILWVPLAELARDDTYVEEWWGTPPLDRPMFFFHLADETVWGATGRMLHELLRVAFGIDGPAPPTW